MATGVYSGEEVTISCFASEQYEHPGTYTNHEAVGYQVFRGGESEAGLVGQYEATESRVPEVFRVAMAVGEGTGEKPIYCGVSVSYNRIESHIAGIFIYRYTPEEDDDWTTIGVLSRGIIPDMGFDMDLALSASESDLVVFWGGLYSEEEPIYGYTITSASTSETIDDFSDDGVALTPEILFHMLDADWDTGLSPQRPRIVWTEYDSGVYKVNAARVDLNPSTQQPTEFSYSDVISDNTSDALNPTIVVNRYSGTGEVYEAFCSYTESTTGSRVDLEVTSGADYWQDPEDVISGYGFYPYEMGVTYRAFGSPLHIWIKSGVIFTERGILEDMTNLSSVKLYTSRKKNWNIFSSYKQDAYPHQIVIIRHLAP